MQLFEELKRRNVFRIGIAYLITAWLLLQVVDLVLENIGAPDWVMQAFMLALAVGFPIAVLIAWAFEMTPEGLKKEKEVDRSNSITHVTGHKLDRAIIAVLVVALGYFVWDKFSGEDVDSGIATDSTAETTAETSGVAAGEAEQKSIAVLPFANRSSRDEDAFFADGIHDDLLTSLAKVGSLKVISRTSVMRYRESDLSIPEIAKELGVNTILEGGIQRSADQVRINVQLIDAFSDEHLWAENYDRALSAENLFAIQSEISRKIVSALKATLTDEESERLAEQPTDNLEAYGEFVLGRQQLAERSTAALERAHVHFEKAVELDPNYSLAYVGLADSLDLQANYGDLFLSDTFEPRQAAIDRALALNPNSGEAYTSLGALRMDQTQYEASEDFFLKAIELSPNYTTSYHWYANLLYRLDRNEEAVMLARKAKELDPNAPIISALLAGTLWDLERHEEALEVNQQQLEKTPEFPNLYSQRIGFYSTLGELGKAAHWAKAYADLDASHSYAAVSVCNALVQLGAADEAATCYDRAEEAFPEASFGAKIGFYQMTGDYPAALDLMRQVAERFPFDRQQVGLGYNLILNVQFDEAIDIVKRKWPEILGPEPFEVTEMNDGAANMAATALYATGDIDRANYLYDQLLAHEATEPRSGITPVFIHTVRGEKQEAIAALRAAIDDGWRGFWFRLRYPLFDVMLEEPEWVNLITELEADITRQRRWYEEHQDQPVF